MGEVIQEKELEFDFTTALNVIRFDDEQKHGMSHCMKAVDFLVEWDDSFWFVEVKDPSATRIPPQYKKRKRKEFMKKIQNHTLFSVELGPKLKDSFLYLHLNKQLPNKSLKYFVLLALDSLGPEMLTPLSDTLKTSTCLLGPDNSSWKNQYIESTIVFTEKTWNTKLAHCPVKRIV